MRRVCLDAQITKRLGYPTLTLSLMLRNADTRVFKTGIKLVVPNDSTKSSVTTRWLRTVAHRNRLQNKKLLSLGKCAQTWFLCVAELAVRVISQSSLLRYSTTCRSVLAGDREWSVAVGVPATRASATIDR
jgi:hypothetical protein